MRSKGIVGVGNRALVRCLRSDMTIALAYKVWVNNLQRPPHHPPPRIIVVVVLTFN